MSCRCMDDGILQGILAIPHHKPGAIFETTGNLTYALVLLLLQLFLTGEGFVIYKYLQVVWGGVAGGAGALLWFLITQVQPHVSSFKITVKI